jgi:DHHC palmitoyltransferase
MNVAQRRGKTTVDKPAATVMVESNDNKNKNNLADDVVMMTNIPGNDDNEAVTTTLNSENAALLLVPPPPVRLVATVRRHTCGTGPFDKHWLNWDCCGLICAVFTYFLHAYGVYAVNWVLIPPWMSTTTTTTADDVGGVRSLSWFGWFHTLGFLFVSFMAVASHFQAMTTDPGAVPPDAKPLPNSSSNNNNHHSQNVPSEKMQSLMDPLPTPPVKRLCRRCKTFKPPRAHHCSVCQRCIIKMDHHCPYVYTVKQPYSLTIVFRFFVFHFLQLGQ